jgi:hypothetical protein
MTTAAAARRAAEEKKVGSFLDAMRRPDSRAGKLTPPPPEPAPATAPARPPDPVPVRHPPDVGEERGPAAGSGAPPSPPTQEASAAAGAFPATGQTESGPAPRPEGPMPQDPEPSAPAAPAREPAVRSAPGRETETVIRVPATMDDVFAQLETPWEPRDRLVLVRSYSMDPVTTQMLKELQEIYGVDMSTLVRQAVKGLYVEARRRRRPGARGAPTNRKPERGEAVAGRSG